MNEFCVICEDKRGELCPLPGRVKLFAGFIVDTIVGIGATHVGPDTLSNVDPSIGNSELRSTEVVACIELHKVQSTNSA